MTGDALILDYLPLANAIGHAAGRRWPSLRDDFLGAARLGLVQAARVYDPDRGVSFAHLVHRYAGGRILDLKREHMPRGWHCPRNRVGPPPRPKRMTPEGAERKGGRVFDCEPDEPVERRVDAVDAVETLCRRLPEMNAAVLWLIYVRGLSREKAGRELGKSMAWASQIHSESIQRLREALA